MMEISRKSWHYRVVKAVYGYANQSLCIYFWQVVSALVVHAFHILFILFILFVAAFAFAFFAVPITWGIGELGWIEPVVPFEIAVVPIFVITVAVLAAALIIGINTTKYLYEEYRYKRNRKKKLVAKEPNLVVEYWRAKKQKVCPTLKFKD